MGDYPGSDYTMSMYGLREKNPGEEAGQWKEFIQAEKRIHNNHIAILGDGTSMFPGVDLPKGEMQSIPYFDNIKKNDNLPSQYDRMFHVESDYNSRLHRDDRQHTVGLDIQAEESARMVPVLSSSLYGSRVNAPLEDTSVRSHVRIDKVMKGFYRTNGTGIPSSSSMQERILPSH